MSDTNDKKRKLSKAEQKRKDDFDNMCRNMQENGYTMHNNTISLKKANVISCCDKE